MMKLQAIPRFPALVQANQGITVTKANGVYTFTGTVGAIEQGAGITVTFNAGVYTIALAAIFNIPFTNPVSAPSYVIANDTILTHPLTPSPDNDAGTIITLGKGAGFALAPIHSTQYLTLLGFNAGSLITTADHITAVGAWALSNFTTGFSASMTAIGIDSMRALTSGAGNVGVGEHTITSALSASFCTAVGVNASNNAGGTYNTFIGYSAGQGTASPSQLTGSGNTGIGHASLNLIAGAGQTNSALGEYSLAALTTGSGNVGIGFLVGQTLQTGNNNILIGTTGNIVDVPLANTSNYLNIGNVITGTGIGTATPSLAISGTAANDNAAAGKVGEYLSASRVFGAATALVSTVAKTVTSISLTAGDWDVCGSVYFSPSGTTSVTILNGSISSVDNTLGVTDDAVEQLSFASTGTVLAAITSCKIPAYRVSIAVTTTIYLVAAGTFTVSTLNGYGKITARRVR